MSISTHVLDTSGGHPAAGLHITLFRQEDDRWIEVAAGVTDDDGRIGALVPRGETMEPGVWRIHFDTGAWHAGRGIDGFYPFAEIAFRVTDPTQHYHVPLLLNPFGYSTYRGS